MRKRPLLALAALLVTVCGSAWAAGQAAGDGVSRITQREFKLLLVSDRVLAVDVRDPFSFSEGHIPGAINVPETDLRAHLARLRATRKTVVAYCA